MQNQTVDALALIQASQYSYWRVSVTKPEETVVSKSATGSEPVPGDLVPFACLLAKAISEEIGRNGSDERAFTVAVQKLRFRVQMMGLSKKMAAARLVQTSLPDFEDLRLGILASKILRGEELRRDGGLVIFSGPIGSGKTTTAMATIDDQLKEFGGFCLSIEDPIEFPAMSGFHGEKGGFMEQIAAKNLDYHTPLIEALRCFPPGQQGILFIGEIRDPKTAAEALRFSLAGNLVITTIHSSNEINALNRILSLASMGGESQARNLLASSLKLVVHQTLEHNTPFVRMLKGSIDPNSPVCGRIMSGGDLSVLQDHVEPRQKVRASLSLG
jgi:twitching motility protein PilT